MMGSASGKVILLGEHAVVYGVPAIVVGIDRGATAHACAIGPDSAKGPSELVVSAGTTASRHPGPADGQMTVRVTANETSDLARAFSALLGACGVSSPVHVEAMTDLPAAAGLGCSAALGVAIVRALDAWQGKPGAGSNDVVERAMAWEKVFHGNPSGVDATAAARGGCILYERRIDGASMKEIRRRAPLKLAIGHTGTASTTRVMVEQVAKLRERKGDLVGRTFEGIRSLVANARLALEANDDVGLGRLMDLNQMLLSGLMLSTEEIETMCRVARDAGAFGAKLTGSGGGGCVVALARGDAEPILASWEKAGFRSFSTQAVATPTTEPERSDAP